MKLKEPHKNFSPESCDKILEELAQQHAINFSTKGQIAQGVIGYSTKVPYLAPLWYSLPNTSIKSSERSKYMQMIKSSINESLIDLTITQLHTYLYTDPHDEERLKVAAQIDASFFADSIECVCVQIQFKGNPIKKTILMDVIRDGEKLPYLNLANVLKHDDWKLWFEGEQIDWFK